MCGNGAPEVSSIAEPMPMDIIVYTNALYTNTSLIATNQHHREGSHEPTTLPCGLGWLWFFGARSEPRQALLRQANTQAQASGRQPSVPFRSLVLPELRRRADVPIAGKVGRVFLLPFR